ncbi:MAG: hypothetical protein JSR82_12880 [Verrucomicrobia bacterium]|nr:hypothetical protein [Verrucomicrobiota bacterium]
MAPRSYAAPWRDTSVWTVWSILTVIAFLATIFASIHFKLEQHIGVWAIVLPLAVMIGLPVLVGVVQVRRNRARARSLGQVLAGAGWRVDPQPELSKRAAHYQRAQTLVERMHLIRPGLPGFAWIAWEVDGTLDRPDGAVAFEYEYVVGSGKSAQSHVLVVIAWPEGHPELAPGWAELERVTLGRPGWRERRLFSDQGAPPGEFAERLPGVLSYGSALSGDRVLRHPAVQEALREAPKGECWQFGGGWVAVSYDRALLPEGVQGLLERGRTVVAKLRG